MKETNVTMTIKEVILHNVCFFFVEKPGGIQTKFGFTYYSQLDCRGISILYIEVQITLHPTLGCTNVEIGQSLIAKAQGSQAK